MGLTDKEVEISRSKNGSNMMSKKKGSSFFSLLIESLADPIIKILLIALAIKVVFLFKSFDWFETLGILIAIFLASFISSISEYGSNKSFERLLKESQLLKCKVYRNNTLTEVYVKDVVVGDIVKVSSGDKLPADGNIIEGNLSLDESFMTGESKEVYKRPSGDSRVYGGSVVYKGDALIKVTKVGDQTFMGTISLEVQDKNDDSPLRNRLKVLAGQISRLGYIGAFLSALSYLFIQIVVNNHFDFNLILSTLTNFKVMFDYLIYALTLCVTIIIMAVPEGLPMMITLVLSSNMKKMLKDKVLVRRLVGIETSGSLNVLFCDKTGTLTEGNLKVEKIITKENDIISSISDLNKYPKYKEILDKSLYLNNESTISSDKIIGGNTTDRAIMRFFKDVKTSVKVTHKKEFDSKNKYSFVKCTDNNMYFKGASEVLLPKCTRFLDKNGVVKSLLNTKYLEEIISKHTALGYRVLLNCYSDSEKETSLIFISVIVLSDTIRKEAKESIATIQKSGIKVVMITGDSKKTAMSIGSSLGLVAPGSLVFTHEELEKLTDDEIKANTDKIAIIARALPQDKGRLVSIYKEKGLVTGMTGDGVNDALALKKADVGFALGSGCEVAKEASDIVILDDNIGSICKAILYGRTIFKSIRKFVTYQLTVNCCALFLSIVGTLVGIATPITIIQMLWLNMIMDTFAGLAFSYEPPLPEYMDEKPKKSTEPIMNRYMFNEVFVNGLYSAIICLLFLKLPWINSLFRADLSHKYLMTAFFALFIFLGIINSFLARTHRINLFAHIQENKVFMLINFLIFTVQIFIIYYGGDIFRTYGLTIKEFIPVMLLALSILPVDLIRKKVLKSKNIPLGM